MGYDKPDLGFVVHFQGPGSPIAYYQQVGRAGRGLKEADADPPPRHRGPRRPGLLHQERLPAGRAGRQGHGALRRGRRPALGRRPDERDQPRQGPDGADAQAARGRGRPQQGPRGLGAQPPRVDLRRGADHRRHRRPPRRAEGHGGLRHRRPLPHGVRSGSSSTTRAPSPAGDAASAPSRSSPASSTAASPSRPSPCSASARSRSSRASSTPTAVGGFKKILTPELIEPGRALSLLNDAGLGPPRRQGRSGRTSTSPTSLSRPLPR